MDLRDYAENDYIDDYFNKMYEEEYNDGHFDYKGQMCRRKTKDEQYDTLKVNKSQREEQEFEDEKGVFIPPSNLHELLQNG